MYKRQAVLFSWLPFIFALVLSLGQLGWVTFHSKRMSLYNEQLDGFIRITAVYLRLIRRMEEIPFHSTRLADLKERLMGKNQHALKAFATLNYQLNRFEQRGNFLANSLLNGLGTHTFYVDVYKRQSEYAEMGKCCLSAKTYLRRSKTKLNGRMDF